MAIRMTNNNVTCIPNISDLILYMLPVVTIVPVAAIPANALVVRVLLKKPRICSTSEIFTLNMSVFDLLFCHCVLVEFYLLTWDQRKTRADFSAWGFNQAGGPTMLSLMSLDSYLGVCRPLLFLRLKNPKIRLLMCLMVNIFTAFCSWSVKSEQGFNVRALSIILVANFWIITSCNIAVIRTLKKSGPLKKKLHPVKRRAVKVIITAFLLINIHYIPPLIEYLIRINEHSCKYTAFTSVAYTVLSISSISQPLCFLIRTKQLHKMFPWTVDTRR